MLRQPAVYIMTNKKNGTSYTGVTSNLPKRAYQHRSGETEGFTSKQDCKILVYYEVYNDMINAIAKEKQIKAGSRKKKLQLIEKMNPKWEDLYETLF